MQEQPWLHKPKSEIVLNYEELSCFPEITTKLKIVEDLAKSVGKKKITYHKIVRTAWKRSRNPEEVIRALDLKIRSLTVECENRKAEGKSLIKPQNREWITCYRELSTEYFRENFSEEDLKTFLEKREAPYYIRTIVFQFCDEKFLSKFPQINRKDWMIYRQNLYTLRFFPLISEALRKQGPQDPSSRQTGDLPTPSYHGLGLLAMAASNAANSLHLDVEPPKDPRSLDQLLQAMDPRQESDVPDSDNDGRGASESLCSSDGYDDPGKDPPSSGSGERPRQSAFACSGRSKGDPLLARFKRSMIERYREIPGLIDSSSEDEAAAPQSSVTASRGSAAAGADAGGVGGAQAGGVAGAQASGTEGELTFTESLPLCLSRLTAARADWQPPPICQCRSID